MSTPAPLSLAELAPFQAAILGVSLDALRDRERRLRHDALTRHLGFQPARGGPGGGTPASASNAAALCVAALCGAGIGDLPRVVLEVWHGVPIGSSAVAVGEEAHVGSTLKVDGTPPVSLERCGLTGQTTFGAALRTVLGDRDLARRVHSVTIYHDLPEAHLSYRVGREVNRVVFCDPYTRPPSPPWAASAETAGAIFAGDSISAVTPEPCAPGSAAIPPPTWPLWSSKLASQLCRPSFFRAGEMGRQKP